jgi:glycosyltransferase involved in cell wall biosynthesis
MKNLSIVIPIYNEEANLSNLIKSWVDFCEVNCFDLILVNDGSTDLTKSILNDLQTSDHLKVLHHKVNRGYGAAIKTGINCSESTFVVTMDGDGQHELVSILDLLKMIEIHDADMVIGSREKENRVFSLRNVGKWLIRMTARILIPNHIQDLNSGMKIYRTKLAKRFIKTCPDTMAFSDIIVLTFISEGALVMECPITIKPRLAGKSTINLRSAFDTFLEIINIVMFFNPLRIFFPLSMLFFLAGLGWGLPILIQGRGLSVGSLFAFIISIMCLLLGFIAEQLSQLRKMAIRDRDF